MYTEFFTGSDSFQGGRTVQFATLVYNPITALFENPRTLKDEGQPVCRDVKITQGIPASVNVLSHSSQMWYHYRAEARNGSLWLFESRIRNTRQGPFGYDTSYLLLRLNSAASALRCSYTLPRQEDANIHKLEFTLNARRITTSRELTPDERGAFKKFVGETRDIVVDVTQSDAELARWNFQQLEPDAKKRVSLVSGGARPVAINRIRRIRK